MILLFSFIFLFWIVVFWQKVGYYLYFWQLKEYRFFRVFSGLQEPFGYSILLTKSFYITLFALFVFATLGIKSIPLVFPLYLLGAISILYRIFQGELKFPRLTAKSFLLYFLILFAPLIGFFYLPFFTLEGRIAYLLLVDILTSFIVTSLVVCLKPVTYVAKQFIVMRAKVKRAKLKNLIAVGVTGSFGKTSTKEFLAHILASKSAFGEKVAHTKDHQNTEIGSARAILAMPENTQILVAEMAAYQKGDIKEISEVVKPAMGIITAIGPQHLALFGTMETIVDTKFELAKALPRGGTLIVNWDNEYIKLKVKSEKVKVNILKYSIENKKADVYADGIKENLESLEFTVHSALPQTVYGNEVFKVNLIGKHNVSNILAATTAALVLGMTLKEISEALADLASVPHTMHLHWLPDNIPVVDDSYNASVDGVRAALDYLKNWQDKKRILVMPSLIELGEKAFIYHEELGQEIAKVCDTAFITDIKYKEALWRGWKSVNENADNLHFHQDSQRLIQELKQAIDEKSVILIEGRISKEVIDFLLHR